MTWDGSSVHGWARRAHLDVVLLACPGRASAVVPDAPDRCKWDALEQDSRAARLALRDAGCPVPAERYELALPPYPDGVELPAAPKAGQPDWDARVAAAATPYPT